MDILIKNMEMPKEGFVRMMLWHDGGVAIEVSPNNYEQLEDNAVELPPHGRLIDGDHLKGIIGYLDVDFSSQDMCQVRRAIDNAPTVLEAST